MPREEPSRGTNPFEGIAPIIRADALAYAVFQRRDPETMSRFLSDFGFTRIGTPGPSLCFRGFADLPYCVEIIPGEEDRFVGFGLLAEKPGDLEALAQHAAVPVQTSAKPGGGRCVRLVDPNGFVIELLDGIERVEPIVAGGAIESVNTPWDKRRVNVGVRPPAGPAPVRGLGHVVLQTPDFDGTVRWHMKHFGYLATDILQTSSGHTGLGFFRLDRGSKPADHHSLAILAGPAAGLLHMSTETVDLDAVGQGQQHLKSQGWRHHWGIGRHILGSQIFDYWKDPAGDEWEHYADGDVMDSTYPTGVHLLDRGGLWAWGDDLPASMRPPGPAPAEAPEMVRELVDALLKRPRPWLD